ncbi:ParB/RepB/Spo0J family partition protein [Pelagibacterium halotolerans]|uniref:Putative plasmid stabilization protein n=1 Tax=Pelagibacterium halotolerans (strain DSM 22347 / JCM 15775 / CGMCC 1.7692 / B2) TaxID=1082931 RepID=G4RDR9_PELHB|nr:ParB/RepB/Spo0J family partition protein [Pelagibacterium halotolerans]AEQ52855.1 putative plasmid stabilization protein [Pelagibacterium halotolerans B2]QJR17465.1 chromosome partitioning protein ParB [Pelagibacterium halotolerans]SEA74703.1 chromosome partitioning protein, ParB family [Pelagibacterium halotolerans]
MAKSPKKIVFSRSRDIPFDKLVISEANVRQIRPETGLDELTQDIDRREDLIQGLNVRALVDENGEETGFFEVPAGGRRYRAIARLVKAKRFPKDGLVPCVVRKSDTKILKEDDSLAENVQRAGLHPLDQFRAFKSMVDQKMSRAEVASAYFTTERFVEQRLRLTSVSPKLLDVYADGGMTLELLEAFTVNPDHDRQEQVWDAIQHTYRQPWQIRQMLTEAAVPSSDKRAIFVGTQAYEQAGGGVLRDLFSEQVGFWLEDPALLDRLTTEKLKAVADEIAAEGWKWIAVDVNLPYGYSNGLRALARASVDLTEDERAERESLRDEYAKIEAEYEDVEEYPDEIDQRLGEIETALEAFENRPVIFEPLDISLAGVFVGLDRDGELIVDRGYVRPEDEAPVKADAEEPGTDIGDDEGNGDATHAVITIGGDPAQPEDEDDEGEAVKPLPERLVMELTAHRTLALRDALAANPEVAVTALLHKLVRDTFSQVRAEGVVIEANVHRVHFREQGKDLPDAPYAQALTERHENWKADIPSDDDELWGWIEGLDNASRHALLAHCVSFGVNALYERPNQFGASGISQRGLDRRMAEAERLAHVTGLDMVEAGFRPTVENYLGRVTKRHILEAVREGVGDQAAQLIDHLKKPDMAREAERLLADSGWLPEPLRGLAVESDAPEEADVDALPDYLSGGDEPDADASADFENEATPPVAAE